MDLNQDWETQQNKDQAWGLLAISVGYGLFVFSSLQYSNESWFPVLISTRVFLLISAMVLGLLFLFNKVPKFFNDTFFYTLCLGIQSLHGILEPSQKTDFYSYTGIFYIIAALSIRTTFKKWLRQLFGIQLSLLIVPLFFKDAVFFTGVGRFIDSFSLPVSGFIIGSILAWITTQKVEVLQKNILLEKQLTEEKQKALLLETARAEKYRCDLEAAKLEISKTVQLQSFKEIAFQVSHDIRSPLTALNMVAGHMNQMPEQQRILVRSAVNRINDIANQLLAKGKQLNSMQANTPEDGTQTLLLKTELISSLIETVISEKRVQFRDKQNIEIESDLSLGYGLFANINATEFCRCLSNIANNAIEALPKGKGYFSITLTSSNDSIIISARDNGIGIPEHVLKKLGALGVTYGKENTESGSGLGIYHAKKTIEGFGGKFNIQSQEGIGTTILITLPKASAPQWFVERLSISNDLQVVSLDDDLSIHQIWQERFSTLPPQCKNMKHVSFTSGSDFKNWFNQSKTSPDYVAKKLFLLDFELLNQKENGLNIIEDLKIGSQSILVTSRFDEDEVRKKCDTLGVRILPKSLAGWVPIK